jgi:hypothetical protein
LGSYKYALGSRVGLRKNQGLAIGPSGAVGGSPAKNSGGTRRGPAGEEQGRGLGSPMLSLRVQLGRGRAGGEARRHPAAAAAVAGESRRR